jgi:tRNA threonylcarbamoyladenosine biosynthesis protein TsaB
MKILAMDSSAVAASVALCEDGRLLGESTILNGNTHSQTLLPMVESLLAQFEITTDEIDLFAVSNGPGSFTGVRIGVATLKGLAFGKNKPCVGVSTLEALANNLAVTDGLICPVMNARRKQVYTALFRSDGQTLQRLLPDAAMSLVELDEILSAYGEPVAFCGDGYDVTLPAIKKASIRPIPERLRHASAFSVALCALRAHEAGLSVNDASLAVTYLRPCQAERERMERENANKS